MVILAGRPDMVYLLSGHIPAPEGHKMKQEPGNAVVTGQAVPN